ncbi:glycosyltransferase [Planctomicrobium sp. SH668]|uniref:glycosyltransferase n=1 Tax=Planctomicrobium sp. SH668 TaxID=3448126 RepID=UPI003F5B6BA2
MTKLLIVIPTLDQSGAEKQFAMLACQLPKEEFTVRVVTLSRGGPFESMLNEHGIPYSILKKRWRLDPITIWKLRREIQAFQPDVVLSCLFAANATVRLATIGLARPPRTIISERCVDSWKSGWQLALDRRLQSRTDLLIANSQSVRAFYAGVGFPECKIAVVPNGVEVPPLPGISREEFLKQLNLPEDAKLVMYVGRLAKQKRLKSLLWATKVLSQSDPTAYLLIAGDGPEKDDLLFYAQDVEVERHVRFLGHRRDASSLLHLCDVFWIASEFEGMSNSLMEAMACGRPSVVSDIPPNRELVRHDQDGFVANLGDSLGFSQYTERILNSPELAARLGESARQRMLQEFSVSCMVDRYRNLLSNSDTDSGASTAEGL